MKFFIHPINPHCGPDHSQTYQEGWHWGIWEHPHPSKNPDKYRFQAMSHEEALATQEHAQQATVDLQDLAEQLSYALPSHLDTHGQEAGAMLSAAAR